MMTTLRAAIVRSDRATPYTCATSILDEFGLDKSLETYPPDVVLG